MDIASYYLSEEMWAEAIDAANHVSEPFLRGITLCQIVKVQLWKGNLTAAIDTAKYAEKTVKLSNGDSNFCVTFVTFWLTLVTALIERGHTDGVMAYFDIAWRAAQEVRADWVDTKRGALSSVIVAMAKAGYVDAAIRRYKEAAGNVPQISDFDLS